MFTGKAEFRKILKIILIIAVFLRNLFKLRPMLNFIFYYGFLYPLSLLPLRVLYLISDFAYLNLYYIFGYRKKVVAENLRSSFPEKSEEELKIITKKFYHHLADLIVESVKNFSMSEKEMKKRMHFLNPELMEHYYKQKRNVLGITGHYCSWEWAGTSFSLYSKHKAGGIYLPIKNKFWNELMKKTRGRFGVQMISPKEVGPFFEENKNTVCSCGFVADQSPGNPEKAYWMDFLNHDTAVSFGSEKFANDYNCVTVFGKMKKIKRGYYTIEYVLITEDPKELPYGKLTEIHTKMNEENIRSAPEFWVWTHKRWKHKRVVKP